MSRVQSSWGKLPVISDKSNRTVSSESIVDVDTMAWNNLLRNVDIGIAAHQLGNNGDFIPFTHHDVGHNYIRLLNILSYASFTLSHRPILTPRGIRRLVERHIITPREHEILVSASKLPATQKHNMVLLWITRAIIEAREAGISEVALNLKSNSLSRLIPFEQITVLLEGNCKLGCFLVRGLLSVWTIGAVQTFTLHGMKMSLAPLHSKRSLLSSISRYYVESVRSHRSGGSRCSSVMDLSNRSICLWRESYFEYFRHRMEDLVLQRLVKSLKTTIGPL
jgi:hypothetical protein